MCTYLSICIPPTNDNVQNLPTPKNQYDFRVRYLYLPKLSKIILETTD